MHEHDHENGGSCDCCENDNVIELVGENGETVNVEYLATLKMEQKQYAIMRPCDDNEDSGEIIIMRIKKEGDEDFLVSVDDDEELDMVFDAFRKVASEEFDFE